MIRTPHPHLRGLGLPSAALFSVLALLAFGSFPVFAEANANYEVEHTTLPGEGGGGGNSPTSHNNPGGSESSPGAKQSAAPGAGGGNEASHNGFSKSQNGSSEGTNPSSPGGGSNAQGESGKGGVGGGKSLGSGPVQKGEPKSVNESGGSSPLVPILIAVAVLAAISVGAVLVRQRRGSAGGFSLKRG